MNDKDLHELLRQAKPPEPRLEARAEAVREARRAWEMSRRLSHLPARPTRPWFPALAALAGTAAAFCATVLLVENGGLNNGGSSHAETAAAFEREEQMLRETGELFDGRLKYILLKNGEAQVDIADQPVFLGQKVVLDLQWRNEVWRVIGYSGNTMEVSLGEKELEFDLLVTGDGEVILAGRDFAWSSRVATDVNEISIRASVMEG